MLDLFFLSFFCVCIPDSYFLPLFLPVTLSFFPYIFSFLFFLSVRINEATDFKDHKIQVASCLISLKVEPSPALSVNLSGAPLIKIVLTHILVRINPENVPVSSQLTLVFIGHLLFCVSQSYRENGVIFQLAQLLGVGRPPYQRKEGLPVATVAGSPHMKSISSIFGVLLCKKMSVYH